MPILSNYPISLYPDVNIAAGSIVIYIKTSLSAFKGISTNWDYGINSPKIADMRGILNVLLVIGILAGKITPFAIWHCGTVGDINGYPTPLAKFGEYNVLYPVKLHTFYILSVITGLIPSSK
jgi:hypothetical protein